MGRSQDLDEFNMMLEGGNTLDRKGVTTKK
jgi:hypothetical protein